MLSMSFNLFSAHSKVLSSARFNLSREASWFRETLRECKLGALVSSPSRDLIALFCRYLQSKLMENNISYQLSSLGQAAN